MMTFRQYVEEMDLGISGAPPGESLVRIARLAAQNHMNDLLSFFQTLAAKDPKIRQELDNMNRNNANRPHRPKGKPQSSLDDKDTVVPHAADNLSGLESDD